MLSQHKTIIPILNLNMQMLSEFQNAMNLKVIGF